MLTPHVVRLTAEQAEVLRAVLRQLDGADAALDAAPAEAEGLLPDDSPDRRRVCEDSCLPHLAEVLRANHSPGSVIANAFDTLANAPAGAYTAYLHYATADSISALTRADRVRWVEEIGATAGVEAAQEAGRTLLRRDDSFRG